MILNVSRLAVCIAAFASGVAAIGKITRVGRYLYDDTGSRFYIKGVAYQQQGVLATDTASPFPEPGSFKDTLADTAGCTRDLPFLKQLNINAIRAYSVDSTKNHDACMQMLSAAGIYAIVDLTLPINGSINRAQPEWTTTLLDLYLGTINEFLKYDNVLAFNVGNEVVTGPADTIAAPFIKAAARDVKAYLKSQNSNILVGYAAVDGSTWPVDLAEYLSCDQDDTSIDIYGLNNYRWTNGPISVYSSIDTAYADYNVVAYFSEFGQVTSAPRQFDEVQALFSETMIPIWSGGLAFSYFPALLPDFGLVSIDGNTVTTTPDFTNLAAQFGNVTFTNDPTQASSSPSTYPACSGPEPPNFLASNTLPPTPNQAACDCAVKNAFSCVFTPETTNVSAVSGALFNFTCSALGQLNLNVCSEINADGSAGTYGPLSSCDDPTKLSFVFSAYYEANARNAAACSFSGNATVNPNAPPTETAAEAAATSCLANAQTTSVPTLPAGSGSSGGGSGSGGSGGSGGGKSAASRSFASVGAFLAAAIALGACLVVV